MAIISPTCRLWPQHKSLDLNSKSSGDKFKTDVNEPLHLLGQHHYIGHCDLTGEVFGGLGVEPGDNDGQRLLEALCTPSADVARVLSQIQGPFALLFWQADSQRLWIARDSVGESQSLDMQPLSCLSTSVSTRL